MNGPAGLTETSNSKRFFLSKEKVQVAGLVLWFAAVSLPQWSLVDQDSIQVNIGLYPSLAILLVCFFFLAFRLRAAVRVAVSLSKNVAPSLLVSFGVITIIISMLTFRWSAAAYGILYLLCYVIWSDFWRMSASTQRIFAIRTFYVIVLFLVGAIIIHGLPQSRWIGGIHPNHFGASALALLIVSRLCGKNFYRLGVLLSFAATILVSSRYALLACFAFVSTMYLLALVRTRDGGLRILLLGLCIVVIIFSVLTIDFLWDIIDKLFALSSTKRGIGSNFTGRIDLWNNFSLQFFQKPILGYGFRQRGEYLGTHNAYLNMILENGVAAWLFLVGMFLTGWKMLKASLISDKRWCWCLDFSNEGRREYVSDYGFAVFVALVVSGFFQPQLINFGDSFGILVFLMLGMNSYPVGGHKARAIGLR